MGKLAPWILLSIVLAASVGFAAGWHAKGVSVNAATARSDRQELTDLTADVNQQINHNTAQLQAQQDESARLFAQQALIRGHGEGTRLEIEHAVFVPDQPLGIAPSCPDPSGTAEFERLYEAAAKGADAAHSGPARAGGVP